MSAQGALPVTDLFNEDEKTKIHWVSLGGDSQMSLKLERCSQTLVRSYQQQWGGGGGGGAGVFISFSWQIADDTVGLSSHKSRQLLESDDRYLYVHVC